MKKKYIISILLIVIAFIIIFLLLLYFSNKPPISKPTVLLNINTPRDVFYNMSITLNSSFESINLNLTNTFENYSKYINKSYFINDKVYLYSNSHYTIKVIGYMGPFCYSKFCINDNNINPDIIERINQTIKLTPKSNEIYNLTILGVGNIKINAINISNKNINS
jgi:hypothetical protein